MKIHKLDKFPNAVTVEALKGYLGIHGYNCIYPKRYGILLKTLNGILGIKAYNFGDFVQNAI